MEYPAEDRQYGVDDPSNASFLNIVEHLPKGVGKVVHSAPNLWDHKDRLSKLVLPGVTTVGGGEPLAVVRVLLLLQKLVRRGVVDPGPT